MRKNKIKKTLPVLKQKTKSSSLLTYIIVIFLTVLTLCLIAFSLFWNSSARNLSVEVQKATEADIQNPFTNPIDENIINFEDGILKPAEIDQLLKQIDELSQKLDPNLDFQLTGEEKLLEILEF